MTTICAGGTSGPKTGVDTSVYVDSAFVQSLLPPALAWLYPYLPWMRALEIGDVSTFCATDPPTVPSVPSASDILQFVTGGNISAALAVNDFLQNVAKQYLWRSLCQCTSGSPSAYTPPSDPGGLVSVNNPSIVSGPLAQPCYDFTSSVVNFTGGTSLQRSDINIAGTGGGVTGPSTRGYWVQFDTTTALVSAPAPQLTLHYIVEAELTTPATIYSNPAYVINAGGTRSALFAVPAGADHANYTVNAGTGAGQTSETTRIRVWCQTASPTEQDCCASGPDRTNLLLNQILDLVTIIQRQRVPFAYIDGATHSTLSGAGTLTIPNGLIGLRTTVTTNPGYTGIAGSNPTALFDVGYVSVGDASGWNETQPIRRSPWNWFPSDMSTWTRVGYNLNPGVIVSITELEAEP